MWNSILWNTLVASLLAIILKSLSYSRFLRHRPACVSLGWLLVLGKLCVPACLAIPLWNTFTSENFFRSVDASTIESRMAQTTSLESVARMADALPNNSWDKDAIASKSAQNPMGQSGATMRALRRAEFEETKRDHAQSLVHPWPGGLSVSRNYQTLLLAIWIFVSVGLIGRLCQQHFRLRWIMGQTHCDQLLTSTAQRVGKSFNCRTVPEVRTVEANVSPALVGWLRPQIVVPKWAVESLTTEELTAVLTHEVAHFQRRDHWLSATATLLKCLWWWNPIAWLAVRELRNWLELSCDALALASQLVSPKAYAHALWRIVLKLQESPQVIRPSLAIATNGQRCQLFQQRLSLLLDGPRYGRLSRLGGLVLCVVAVASICYPTARAALRLPHSFRYIGADDARFYSAEAISEWPTLGKALPSIDSQLKASIVARGHFWFGTSDRPVLMALVTRAGNERLELLVDGDRNEQFELVDLAKPVGDSLWKSDVSEAPANAGDANGGLTPRDESSQQSLMIRWTEQHFEIANVGKLVGTIHDGETPSLSFAAVIEDRNCNGLWTDSEDRLHIDWNGDAKYSPLREQYSCQGSPTYGGQRYSLAFVNDVLSLKPLVGSGTITPRIALADNNAEIVSCQAVIASSDGVHLTLSSLDTPLPVPVGKYSVKQLRLGLKDHRHWFASFEQNSGPRTIVNVEKDSQVELNLLGELKLSAEINGRTTAGAQAGQIIIQPMLTSQSGLYLSRSAVGKLSAQSDNPLTATLVEFGRVKQKATAIESTGFGCGAFCPITFSGDELIDGRTLVLLKFDSGPLAGVLTKTISDK